MPTLLLVTLIAQIESASDLVTSAHDLSGLLSPRGHPEITFDLCPASPTRHREDRAPDAVEESLLDEQRVCEWLDALCTQHWGAGIVQLACLDHVLLVTASPSVQAEIDRILERFEAAFLGDERLQVRVLAGEGERTLPLLLDEAEADRRTTALLAGGQVHVARTGTTCLLDDTERTILAVDSESLVRGWDAEIAHGVAIHDPVVDVDEAGLVASVRAAPAPDGTYLDLAIRHEQNDVPRERVFSPEVKCSAEPSECGAEATPPAAATHDPVPLLIEFPGHRFTSWAGSFVLPRGKVLSIPCHVRTQAGDVLVAFEVRAIGRQRDWQALMLDPGSAEQAMLLHVGALGSGGFRGDVLGPAAFENLLPGQEQVDQPAWPSLIETHPREPDLLETLHAMLPDLEAKTDLHLELLSPHCLAVHAPADACRQIAAQLDEVLGPGNRYEISGRVVAGARELAEFRLPALSGKVTTLWSGFAGTFLEDWDVDVACVAAIAKPQIDAFLDGVALRFVIRPTSAGHVQLVLRGKLHFLEALPAPESMANPYAPVCERVAARSLLLDEVMSLDDRTATVRSGDERLAIEVAIRTLP